jgi:hypothetical protein
MQKFEKGLCMPQRGHLLDHQSALVQERYGYRLPSTGTFIYQKTERFNAIPDIFFETHFIVLYVVQDGDSV